MFITLIPIILSLISELPTLIHAAEVAFSGKPGSGDAKKSFVLQSAGEALNIYQQAVTSHPLSDSTKNAILGTVSTVADTVVAGFNLSGIFKTSNPLTPSATPPPSK